MHSYNENPPSRSQPPIAPELLKAALELWGQAGEVHDLPINGASMLPLLREGDQVVVYHTRDVSVGQIAVFQRPDGLISHRVLKVEPNVDGGQSFFTKGDNVLSWDAPVIDTELVGRVVAIRRGSRLLNIDTASQNFTGKSIARLMRLQAELYRKAVEGKTGAFSEGIAFVEKSFSRALLWVGQVAIWGTQLIFGRWTG